MKYSEVVIEDIRLLILQALAEDSDYAQNEHVLDGVLTKLGHGVSTDTLRAQLAWLHDQGLIHVETLGEVWSAKLQRRGMDVAAGRASVPGVRRPGP